MFSFEHLRDPLFGKIEELALTEVDSCIFVIFTQVSVVELLSLIEYGIAFIVGMAHLGNMLIVSCGTECESRSKLFNLILTTISFDSFDWLIPHSRCIFIRVIETAVLLNAPLLVHKLLHELPILLTCRNLLLDAISRIRRVSRLCRDCGILGKLLRII